MSNVVNVAQEIINSLKEEDKNAPPAPSTNFAESVRKCSESQLKIIELYLKFFYGDKFWKRLLQAAIAIVGIITSSTTISNIALTMLQFFGGM